MKKITLEKILYVLHTMENQIEINPQMAEKARLSVNRMIDLSRKLGL